MRSRSSGLIAGGAAALAVLLAGTSSAGAHGWLYLPVWGKAVPVAEVNLPTSAEGCPIETADGLSLLFASNRDSEPNDIWAADRASIGSPWQEPRRLDAPINMSGVADFCPTPVRGRSLMFV